MNIRDVRHIRMHNERLVGAPFDTPEEMVRWHGAVQSQDYAGAKWGIAQRCRGVTDADLDALFNEGRFLRTHMMRPTWHFVMPEDIRWIQALTAPRVHTLSGSMYRKLEIDDAVAARSKRILADALQDGNHLTRTELSEALRAGGIVATGQRLAYLVMWAELDALVCSGPRMGKQFTYALLDDRVPPTKPVPREEALAELTRRYFTSHGPATPHDFSWWSGLTVADARLGLELVKDELTSEMLDGATWWFAPAAVIATVEPPIVHLLPNFDEYFIGFRNREPVFDPAMSTVFNNQQSEYWMGHLVAVNGVIVGGWRRKLTAGHVNITTLFPVDLDDDEREALMMATEDYGRFLGLPVRMDAIAPPAALPG